MTVDWNANTYIQFLDLRTRPAHDLLAAIPDHFQPKVIYDLGCGPGNSTILLKNRWPQAKIIGIDSSTDMLRVAKETYPELEFIKDDIATFAPSEKIDFIFANASLQWVDKHEILIPKLISCLSSSGALAIQMPNNFHSPTHQTTIKLLNNNPSWQNLLTHLRYGVSTQPLYYLPWYYNLLIKSGANALQLWETEYFQEMKNYQEIFDWVSGTGLRPILSLMNNGNKIIFSKAYIDAIANEYPQQENKKILLPFRRIFMVAYAP